MGFRVHHRIGLLVLSFVVALVVTAPAGAQTPPPDDLDEDGVLDVVDECAETPPGDLVDDVGCSLCPCDESRDAQAWLSHQGYVGCVAAEAKRMRKAHLLSKKQRRAAVKRAKRSTCGSTQELTRCCVYPEDYPDDAETIVGNCRIMTPDACLDLGFDADAEDLGGGSCAPNPCVF